MPPSRRLRIAVWNHASKAAPFINALAAAGHEFCQNINDDVDAMLIDLDPPYLAAPRDARRATRSRTRRSSSTRMAAAARS